MSKLLSLFSLKKLQCKKYDTLLFLDLPFAPAGFALGGSFPMAVGITGTTGTVGREKIICCYELYFSNC